MSSNVKAESVQYSIQNGKIIYKFSNDTEEVEFNDVKNRISSEKFNDVILFDESKNKIIATAPTIYKIQQITFNFISSTTKESLRENITVIYGFEFCIATDTTNGKIYRLTKVSNLVYTINTTTLVFPLYSDTNFFSNLNNCIEKENNAENSIFPFPYQKCNIYGYCDGIKEVSLKDIYCGKK